jgi:glucosamine--fructose-6-phosphate aminotransferase (isomerizing)
MCGIVGVSGNSQAAQVILTGLSRLEYRGYDSAGLALRESNGTIITRKAPGKLAALEQLLTQNPLPASSSGIGHTRWATHGAPTTTNAHPHLGQSGKYKLAVVHNGIIENYTEFRTNLAKQGATFVTQTDTEIIPFALAAHLNQHGGTVATAIQKVVPHFHGNFAFVAMTEGGEDLVGTRRGAPLCVGLGQGANYLVSDPLALAGVCSQFIFLEENDIAHITPTEVTITNIHGQTVSRPIKTLDLSTEASGKQGFKHFMLKEIYEQPTVCARILQEYTNANTLLPNLTLENIDLNHISHINIVACGTAHYASQVGKYAIEMLTRIPVNADIASEFRYRNPPLGKGGLFIAVSQSGETADTLAALEHAKAQGQQILVITNTPTSSMARAAHAVINLHAGREIAVASTKAFTAMVLNLIILALHIAHTQRQLYHESVNDYIHQLRTLPNVLEAAIGHASTLTQLATELTHTHSMLYLGRGFLAPLALEGALKMKEISYIHAEGYASGEMKHGPIALIEPGLPVINLAASTDSLFEKTLSNLQEVAARRGRIILITDEAGAATLQSGPHIAETIITVPTTPSLLTPIVFAIPLQMLAYVTATEKGTDVDQPRNLAKSVTVE